MREHPDRETLQRFISGELASEDARLTDRHLAACSECRDRADEVGEGLALQLLDSWLRPGYDEAFENAAEKAADRLAVIWEEGRTTEELLSDLLRAPSPERRRRIVIEERFHSLKLSQLLLSRSREAWFCDPAVALEMASLAVEVSLHLETGRYGSNLVEDSRALAWGYLGNAFRIRSDLWRAEQAMRQAWLHHSLAEQDLFTECQLLSFMASLRSTQGLDDEALKLSDREIGIFREVQDPSSEGVALIKKGLILEGTGRSKEAVPIIRTGLHRIDPERQPDLLLHGRHNLINSLAQSGSPREAWQLLEESRFLYHEVRVPGARLDWLEGNVAAVLRQFKEAAECFIRAYEFLLHAESWVNVVNLSLALANIYMRDRRYRQAKEILSEVIPLGEALGLQKSALAARLLYENASRA